MSKEEFKYLKSESYYSDLYDRFTVEKCRSWEKSGVSKDHVLIKDSKPDKNKIKEEFIVNVVLPTALYFIKGDRYAQKEKTIKEWIDSDRAKDELVNSAEPPEDIQCLTCGNIMAILSKDLHNWGPDKKDRVLFMYDCPNGCLPRRAFFNNGDEYRPKPNLCPKCDNVLDYTNERLTDKIITNYTCSRCGYKKSDELDFSTKKEKIDKNFVKDRERFCLTEEEGREYIGFREKNDSLFTLLKDSKDEEETKKKIAEIRKLNIADLNDILPQDLGKEGYIKLEFSKPEISKDVIIGFTIQDNKSGRIEYDSIHNLKKIINLILSNTNWRLMSEGISYKLGILSGRLRGYENDEDLLKLIKKHGPNINF
jgi:hypothetical protein